jgi:acetoin utilization protein AcuB
MRVRDVMRRRVETVPTTDFAVDARERMRSRRIRHLVVLEGQDVVGVLSSRDLDSVGLTQGGLIVGDVMTFPVRTVAPDATLREAANLLRGRTIGCLPVIDKGELVGILTTTDLLELIGRGVERPIGRTRRWVLKDRGQRPHRSAAG